MPRRAYEPPTMTTEPADATEPCVLFVDLVDLMNGLAAGRRTGDPMAGFDKWRRQEDMIEKVEKRLHRRAPLDGAFAWQAVVMLIAESPLTTVPDALDAVEEALGGHWVIETAGAIGWVPPTRA